MLPGRYRVGGEEGGDDLPRSEAYRQNPVGAQRFGLYRGAVTASLLLCEDPLRAGRCDPYFADHAAAARAVGARVAYLDHDALTAGDTEAAVRRVPEGIGPLWYRGWMIPPIHYAALARALTARGAALLTAPDDYRRAHELPGWFPVFEPVTPDSVWLPCEPGEPPAVEALAEVAASLPRGPGIVKDFVKSRKHEWEEACFIPELHDADGVHRVVARFVALQEDYLVGGIVLRAFERFDHDTGEARVWWLDGRPILTTAHPDTPQLCPAPDSSGLSPLVAALNCRFITTDVARRADGVRRVVEVGDGQVSDLPAGTDPAALLGPLLTSPLVRPSTARSRGAGPTAAHPQV